MSAERIPAPALFTIGHSNHSEEHFFDLLRQHRIDVLVDIRSRPYCRYATHFNGDSIRAAVTRAGMKYLAMGDQLGGRPDGEAFYDKEGHVLYRRVAESPAFLEGISRLEKGIDQYRIAIMCSEENPSICHRYLLVGRVLRGHGVQMLHIRSDGRLQTDAELEAESPAIEVRQTMLFEEMEKDSWRSLRSVLPKQQQPNSLES